MRARSGMENFSPVPERAAIAVGGFKSIQGQWGGNVVAVDGVEPSTPRI